ncbi:MAG: glycosyltransferase [Candidatus Latescibacteria bacterium]|nr:glycosyltransferase [Candidatus Latescibacterota bacterium]
MPELTVLMAVYNAEAYLREAIESILDQTFTDFEFLIINDGSTDASKAIISKYKDPRIHLVNNAQNMGLTSSLNRGLALTTTPLIARQDADDISHPHRLEKQVDFLNKHSNIALVGSQGYNFYTTGKKKEFMYRALEDLSIRWEFLFYNSFIHTAVMFRRDTMYTELGGYDETVNYCQDYELWSRCMRKYEVANLPDALIHRRIHDASMTSTMQENRLSESLRVGQYHLQTLFGTNPFNDTYAKLLTFLQTQNQEQFAQHYQTFFELLAHYKTQNQHHQTSHDFSKTVLRQYIRMISQVQNKNRLQGLQMVLKTPQNTPRSLFSLPWHRIIAKTVRS